MNDEYGYIMLYRKLRNWRWYKNLEVKAIFIDLILRANNEVGYFEGTKVERGQCIVGRKSLAYSNGLTERKVRTAIDKLKSTNEIAIKTTNKFSIITICNYNEYQQKDKSKRPTNRPRVLPTNDQQPTTNNNDNNDNKASKQEINLEKIKVENVKRFKQGQQYILDSRLKELVRVYNATPKTDFSVPSYLRDVKAYELLMLAIEVGINHQKLKVFASELYSRYPDGVLRNGSRVKNFKQFLFTLVRNDQEKLRMRFDTISHWGFPET